MANKIYYELWLAGRIKQILYGDQWVSENIIKTIETGVITKFEAWTAPTGGYWFKSFDELVDQLKKAIHNELATGKAQLIHTT